MGYDYSGYGYDNLGSSLNSGIATGIGATIWIIISLIAVFSWIGLNISENASYFVFSEINSLLS